MGYVIRLEGFVCGSNGESSNAYLVEIERRKNFLRELVMVLKKIPPLG